MGYIGQMTPHHSQIVAQLRTRFPHVQGIYAFGSRVQGGARPDSDLDLAVLLPGYAEPLALWDAAQVLSVSACGGRSPMLACLSALP